MERQYITKNSNNNSSTSTQKSTRTRTAITQIGTNTNALLTQQEIENQQYQQDRFEATKLEIQAKYGTITPQGQEQLAVLQAKKGEFWQKYLGKTRLFSKDFSQIPLHSTRDEGEESKEHKENKTGLPDNLKAGIENLSGMAMDDVRVHYNSDKPAQLQALAYTQGTEIHIAPRQEEHLPHEVWHVVQQAQGNVHPTMQKGGMPINNDQSLEHEADVMGAKAMMKGQESVQAQQKDEPPSAVNQVGKLAVVQGDTAVVQGNFPDSHNEKRRTQQGIDKEAVQLDHMVPQKTLKKFAETYKTLSILISKSSWQESSTKKQIENIRKEFKQSRGDHDFMSENHLINIPNNIVPGLSGQIQGAGNDFDPQVVRTGSSNNLAR